MPFASRTGGSTRALHGPIDEADAELERTLGATQKLVLVDQRDVAVALDGLGQRSSRHPAGRAAAQDDDASDQVVLHGKPGPMFTPQKS